MSDTVTFDWARMLLGGAVIRLAALNPELDHDQLRAWVFEHVDDEAVRMILLPHLHAATTDLASYIKHVAAHRTQDAKASHDATAQQS